MSLTTAPPQPLQESAAAHVRPGEARATQQAARVPVVLLLCLAALYCATTYRIATSKEPFTDEGWFAAPAYNLAFHGFMGSPVMEPAGTWLNGELKGVHQYTYFAMPLDFLAQAAWYRIFGFGLLQMRLLSALWGAIALAAWYVIVLRLTRNDLAASITVFLLTLDFTFLWSATDGRMDMMCVAFGSAALAFYLARREQNLRQALLGANFLAAASVFTHPNGVAWFAMLVALVLIHDWRNLRVAYLATLTPWALFAAGWGAYIARSPADFVAQFRANMNPLGGGRGFGLLHPLWSLRFEWYRYFGHFGDAFWAAPVPRWAICIPFLLWSICIAATVLYFKTRDRALGTILLLLALCMFIMTFADGLKAENYLGMIMPIYAAVAAIWFCAAAFDKRWNWLRYSLLSALLLFQIAVLGVKLSINPLQDDFEPTAAFLESVPDAHIVGDSVFAFDLGYDRLTDDLRLVMRDSPKPDLIVADRWYMFGWLTVFAGADRPALQHVRDVVKDYHPVFVRGPNVVYQRNDYSPPPVPAAAAK